MKVDRDTAYLLGIDPRRDPIVWLRPGRCTGVWIDPGSKGCGHVVRLFYFASRPTRLQRRLGLKWSKRLRMPWPPLAREAVCPVCAKRYPFSFYKFKGDDGYRPTPAQEADIRALYVDLKRMARATAAGRDAEWSYGMTADDAAALHSLAPPKTVDVGDVPDP